MSYKGKMKKGELVSQLHEVADGYNLYADTYEKDHPYLNTFEGDVIFKMLGKLKGLKILDVGCGAGRLTKFLRDEGADVKGGQAEVYAADISEEMLKIIEKKLPGVQTVQAGMDKLPFEDNSFDIVTAAFVIVHLETLEKSFEEVYRILKPGGFFIVTNVNQRKPPKLKLKGGGKIVIKSQYHRPEAVKEALEGCFFAIEKEEFVYADGAWVNQIIKARK